MFQKVKNMRGGRYEQIVASHKSRHYPWLYHARNNGHGHEIGRHLGSSLMVPGVGVVMDPRS
jgi:hypothetical protein